MRLFSNYRIYAFALASLLVLGGIGGASYAKNYAANGGGAAEAAARPLVKIVLSGTVARGGRNVSVEEAGRVNSGEVLNWTVMSVNSGDAPALSHDAVAKIPAGTTYVDGSASSEVPAEIAYSIDGGKTFSARPMVASRQNGQVKQVPAPVSMYTQVRFHWNTPLVSSGSRSASYKVRVN